MNGQTMKVTELTPGQLNELKQSYYCNVLHEGEGVSYGELADIDNLVSNDEVFAYYAGTEFVEDDFFTK